MAELGRRLDRQGAIGDEQARAIEMALLEGLNALGERLIGSARKGGKPGKRLRRSIDDLAAAIADSEARVAERRAVHRHPHVSTAAELSPDAPAARRRRAAGHSTAGSGCYLRCFCFAIAPATRSPVMNMWL